jgi:transcriptional antiterminator RfaH
MWSGQGGAAVAEGAVKKWYLVYTKPRQESVARMNLARQGYEAYLPLMRQTRRQRGRRRTLISPMFPRYLFVHLDRTTDNWGPIRSTLGVVSIVRFGQMAAEAPDALIALLRSREDNEGIQTLAPADFRSGSKVRITDGPFMGCEGIYLARSSRERVVVLLQLCGKPARTLLDSDYLEAVTGD